MFVAVDKVALIKEKVLFNFNVFCLWLMSNNVGRFHTVCFLIVDI